jgi:hypothetical protein
MWCAQFLPLVNLITTLLLIHNKKIVGVAKYVRWLVKLEQKAPWDHLYQKRMSPPGIGVQNEHTFAITKWLDSNSIPHQYIECVHYYWLKVTNVAASRQIYSVTGSRQPQDLLRQTGRTYVEIRFLAPNTTKIPSSATYSHSSSQPINQNLNKLFK